MSRLDIARLDMARLDIAQLDMEFVRSRFPAFAEPGLQGQTFFENAGGSCTCAPVIERLTRYYRMRKVQPYAPYPAAQAAGARAAPELRALTR